MSDTPAPVADRNYLPMAYRLKLVNCLKRDKLAILADQTNKEELAARYSKELGFPVTFRNLISIMGVLKINYRARQKTLLDKTATIVPTPTQLEEVTPGALKAVHARVDLIQTGFGARLLKAEQDLRRVMNYLHDELGIDLREDPGPEGRG